MIEPVEPVRDPAARLAAARVAFERLRPRVAGGEPWPLAEHFGSEPEASWGPREVLAHTAEMLPYWLGEYERLVAGGSGPGDVVRFGRVSTDVLRVGILERDRSLPLRELFDRIDDGIGRWARRLARGSADEGAAVGLHPRLGEMTADALRDRFVIDHLDEHAAQLEDLLAAS